MTDQDRQTIAFSAEDLVSLDEAAKQWQYPLWTPKSGAATNTRVTYYRPDTVTFPHSDFIRAEYRMESGESFVLTQGFLPLINLVYANAPEGAKGQSTVNGQDAIWVTAFPVGDERKAVGNRVVPANWRSGFAGISWQTLVDGDVPEFIVLESDDLAMADLTQIAETVSVGP